VELDPHGTISVRQLAFDAARSAHSSALKTKSAHATHSALPSLMLLAVIELAAQAIAVAPQQMPYDALTYAQLLIEPIQAEV